MAREFLDRRQLHALGLISDRLAVRPARRRDPPAQIDDRLVGHADAEWADRAAGVRRGQVRGGEGQGARRGRGGKEAAACG
jgi:hypothetical protein